MAQLTLRSTRDSALTWEEGDANLLALDSDSPWKVSADHITYDKKVGIAVDSSYSPVYDLDFGDSDSATIGITNGDLNLHLAGPNSLRVWNNTTQAITLNTYGKVGINDSNPDEMLTVDGNIRASNTVLSNVVSANSITDGVMTISSGRLMNVQQLACDSAAQIQFGHFYSKQSGYRIYGFDSLMTTDSYALPTSYAVKSEFDSFSNSLQTQLDSLELSVIDRIDSLEETTIERLDSLEGTTIERLDSLELSIIGRLDSLEGTMIGRLDSLEGTIYIKMDSFESSINLQFLNLSADIHNQVDSLEDHFRDVYDSLDGHLNLKIDNLILGQNNSFDSLELDLRNKFDSLEGHFRDDYDSLETHFREHYDSLEIHFRNHYDSLEGHFRFVYDSLEGHFRDHYDSLETHFRYVYDSLDSYLTNKINNLIFDQNNAFDSLEGHFRDVYDSLDAHLNLKIDNLIIGQNNAFDSLEAHINDVLSLSGLDQVLALDNTSSRDMNVGNVTAASFTKSGGTASQYLMADGSTSTEIAVATASTLGTVKIGYGANAKNYPVQLSSEKMYVSVPWTDTNTTYTVGNGTKLTGTKIEMSGSYTGTFTATGDVVAFSDIAVKEEINPIVDALEKVSQLGGYTFKRKDDDSRKYTGVIAQEVNRVLPEAVHGAKDGELAVAYGNLTGLLIEAVKELSEKVKELESK